MRRWISLPAISVLLLEFGVSSVIFLIIMDAEVFSIFSSFFSLDMTWRLKPLICICCRFVSRVLRIHTRIHQPLINYKV